MRRLSFVIKMATPQGVLASRASLKTQELKLKGAQKGHSLLKKKLDGLKKRFNEIMKEIIDSKTQMGPGFNEALMSLLEARWGAGNFSNVLIETVKKSTY